MIALSLSTAAAIALHAAEGSWVVFVQMVEPDRPGPIKIEGIRGARLGSRLFAIAKCVPYDVQLIGLLPSAIPDVDAASIAADFVQAELHDGWFEATDYILAYVQNSAQSSLQAMVGQIQPGALGDSGSSEESVVTIDRLAEILGVSVPTIRRMVADKAIPALRWGNGPRAHLRFSVADVIASLTKR